MNLPVLQLDDFGITELEVRWHGDDHEATVATSEFEVGYRVSRRISGSPRYRLTMTVKDIRGRSKGEPGIELAVTATGFVSFPEAHPIKEQEQLVRVLGLPMLYSSLRGALMMISGLFPPGSRYVLPTVNMLDVIQDVEGASVRSPEGEAARSSLPRRRPRSTKSASEPGQGEMEAAVPRRAAKPEGRRSEPR
jgi:hypothetical protein